MSEERKPGETIHLDIHDSITPRLLFPKVGLVRLDMTFFNERDDYLSLTSADARALASDLIHFANMIDGGEDG